MYHSFLNLRTVWRYNTSGLSRLNSIPFWYRLLVRWWFTTFRLFIHPITQFYQGHNRNFPKGDTQIVTPSKPTIESQFMTLLKPTGKGDNWMYILLFIILLPIMVLAELLKLNKWGFAIQIFRRHLPSFPLRQASKIAASCRISNCSISFLAYSRLSPRPIKSDSVWTASWLSRNTAHSS